MEKVRGVQVSRQCACRAKREQGREERVAEGYGTASLLVEVPSLPSRPRVVVCALICCGGSFALLVFTLLCFALLSFRSLKGDAMNRQGEMGQPRSLDTGETGRQGEGMQEGRKG